MDLTAKQMHEARLLAQRSADYYRWRDHTRRERKAITENFVANTLRRKRITIQRALRGRRPDGKRSDA